MSRRKSEFIVLSILMLLFINLFAEPPITLAEESTHAVLSGTNTVQSGQPFNLTFGLRGVSQAIIAQDISITYDSEQLYFVGADSQKAGFSIVGQSEKPDQVRIIAISQGEAHTVKSDEDLLTLHWAAKQLASPSAAMVSITNLVISNAEGVELTGGGASHTIQITVGKPSDLNGDNQFTIGDLAIAARAYGKTSEDPDWSQYRRADVNHDGKVLIEDLSIIARAIFDQDATAPNKPVWTSEKRLTVTNVTYSGMTLTWSGAVDSSGVTGFKVYQEGREIGSVTDSVYAISGLAANRVYTFKVEARNASGLWSTDGPSVTVTTPTANLPLDLNGDNKISVSELAIIASAYSRTSNDPEWAKYVRADVNHDGKVDIEDCAVIAGLLLR
ncbi:dockerin type I domain-containing protein [Paenibacillus sp. Soil724D2]|uniref:dockerin type I domain-containing protein n=1 Tax=Paenibacillus sp. (strain Soil724D2) TaxID=1736392 RepID=UPI00138EE57C|nr:dockerin type I domain-containing protein [Paenibacillus sp. Soil724D2]